MPRFKWSDAKAKTHRVTHNDLRPLEALRHQESEGFTVIEAVVFRWALDGAVRMVVLTAAITKAESHAAHEGCITAGSGKNEQFAGPEIARTGPENGYVFALVPRQARRLRHEFGE